MQYLICQDKIESRKVSLFFLIKQKAIWKPDDANTEKQSLDLLFLSSPTSTCKVLSREIGGKNTTGS